MKVHSTAILFFSRRAAAEVDFKRWTAQPAGSRNLALAQEMIRETGRAARRSGLPVYHVHEGKQLGDTFGERLRNAFGDLFGLGYDSVIAIGNDTPGLARVDWTEVTQQLEAGRSVVGTTVQGGAYLIGLRATDFDGDAFASLPWETPELANVLTDSLSAPFLLASLHELNDHLDFEHWVRSSGVHHALARRWALLLAAATPFVPQFIPLVSLLRTHTRTLRGPPIS